LALHPLRQRVRQLSARIEVRKRADGRPETISGGDDRSGGPVVLGAWPQVGALESEFESAARVGRGERLERSFGRLGMPPVDDKELCPGGGFPSGIEDLAADVE